MIQVHPGVAAGSRTRLQRCSSSMRSAGNISPARLPGSGISILSGSRTRVPQRLCSPEPTATIWRLWFSTAEFPKNELVFESIDDAAEYLKAEAVGPFMQSPVSQTRKNFSPKNASAVTQEGLNMECKLLYLYDDLMNLYGENGNIRVLTRHLQDQGFSVTVDRRSLSDSLDFSGYALIYLGSGTESARNVALRHLVPYRDALREAEQAGTIPPVTGNAWEMLGASVTTGPEKRSRASTFCIYRHGIQRKAHHRRRHRRLCLSAASVCRFINKCSEAHGVACPLSSAGWAKAMNPAFSCRRPALRQRVRHAPDRTAACRNPAFLCSI